MKQIDIKDLSDDDLNEKLLEQIELLVKLRMNHAVSPLDNPNKIVEARKNVARIKTEMRSRQMQTQSEK